MFSRWWRGGMSPELQRRVWGALAQGGDLSALGLPIIDGRVSLRGLRIPGLPSRRNVAFDRKVIAALRDVALITGQRWRGLDFTGCDLRLLCFIDSSFEDCVFDDADCTEWRAWRFTVERCSFRRASLRGAVLSPVSEGKRNSYTQTDFAGADLRDSIHSSGDFIDCDFSLARVGGVSFDGNVFVRCRFAGPLHETRFARESPRAKGMPPNEMRDVDLSAAVFYFTEFRGLDMDSVKWPEAPGHVLVDRYPEVLDRIIAWAKDKHGKRFGDLVAALEYYRAHVGPVQRLGVVVEREFTHPLVFFGTRLFGITRSEWNEVLKLLEPYRVRHPPA